MLKVDQLRNYEAFLAQKRCTMVLLPENHQWNNVPV